MEITQQAFADAVIAHVDANPITLNPEEHESQVSDHWTYRAEGRAMTGDMCLASHGMFDRVYKRAVILPTKWKSFCEQFYSPEARLLFQLYRECQQSSWLTWNPEEVQRDDAPMTGHFWTRTHQDRTYVALLQNLRYRGIAARPTRTYTDDPYAIGIKMPNRTVDFPGSYRTLEMMIEELTNDDTVYHADIPRDLRLYGDSKPVLHMIGDVVDDNPDELRTFVNSKSNPKPKFQQVVYVLSEVGNEQLIARRVGRMWVSVLEIAYGSVAGAIHWDMDYIVPNDLSADEEESYDCSRSNWAAHSGGIIKHCPAIVTSFAMAA